MTFFPTGFFGGTSWIQAMDSMNMSLVRRHRQSYVSIYLPSCTSTSERDLISRAGLPIADQRARTALPDRRARSVGIG